jgi:DNA-binding response OmpR family regulator
MSAPAQVGGRIATRVLQRLALSPGRAVTQEALVVAAYGDDPSGGPEDPLGVIRIIVSRLRKRLPEHGIETVWGVGYRMSEEAAAAVEIPDDRRVILARADDGSATWTDQ